ncbi:MAG: amidohydrolase family protein [Gammaproteobacteria bacterium]|nr:amidohydrolase family protein [Gammaproteobacteria bacterium]
MSNVLTITLLSLSSLAANAESDYLFTNGHLITMASPDVIQADLLVRDGRIKTMGRDLGTSVNTTVIDMRGGYLIPGLAEMHAHVPAPNQGQQYRDDVLFLWIAHGITTARGMLGHPDHLALKQALMDHRVSGPRLITSGPSFNGNSVSSPDQAREMVRAQKAAGYDFLKIHPGLTLAEYDAMAEEARLQGIGFAGHVPAAVGLTHALERRQLTIDHLDGYIAALVPEPDAHGNRVRAGFGVGLTPHADITRLVDLVRQTHRAGAWIVPTQTLLENSSSTESAEELISRAQNVYLPRTLLANFSRRARNAARNEDLGTSFLELRSHIIKSLHDGGVGILLGSDSPQYFNVPGVSIHRELESMVAAGLTPYEALATGTTNPARFFGLEKEFGRLQPGLAADLVWLSRNPLENIANSRSIEGVMIRGRWMDKRMREAGLADIARRNGGS